MSIKRFLMITTGGTIAGNVATETHDSSIKEKSDLSKIEKLVEHTIKRISEDWASDVSINEHSVCDVDSSDILPSNWTEISDIIREKYDNYEGFIVTHGTNTMGYTCAALSFALENIGKPVVVTGSQVPSGWPGSDALMNLDNAIRVAAWPHDEIRGVICVFGSHIISGTRAKKSTEFDYDAFQSFSSASLGRIGRIIQMNKANLERHNQYLRPIATSSRNLRVSNQFDMNLLSFTEFPGMNPDIFLNVFKSLSKKTGNPIKGVIFRAFGAGDVSTHLHEAFRYLKSKEIPIVVTTQAPNGNSNFMVNTPGQSLAKERLAIPAHDMSIESMTTKLGWLIGQNYKYDEIVSKMAEDLHGEITVFREAR